MQHLLAVLALAAAAAVAVSAQQPTVESSGGNLHFAAARFLFSNNTANPASSQIDLLAMITSMHAEIQTLKSTIEDMKTTTQTRVSGNCPPGQAIRSIADTGAVVCQDTTPDDKIWQRRITPPTCPTNQFVSGIAETGVATCTDVDLSSKQNRVTGSCSDGQAIASIGASGTVTCAKGKIDAVTCPGAQVVNGFDASGNPKCSDIDDNTWQRRTTGACDASNYVSSINKNGALVCTPEQDISDLQKRVSGTCPPGQSIQTIKADGTVTCHTDIDVSVPAAACAANQFVSGIGADKQIICTDIDKSVFQARVSNTCSAGSYITSVDVNGAANCTALPDTDFTKIQARIKDTCSPSSAVSTVDQAGNPTCLDSVVSEATITSITSDITSALR